jgi:hypothetical protein
MSTLVTRVDPPRPVLGEGRRSPPVWRRIDTRTLALHGAVIAGFLAIAVVMWWHVWVTGHPTTSVTCQCGDISEELGYLAWTPYALAHLHNPFLSHAIYAGQGGANMLDNTSNLLLGTLLAPVTWLFGPVATFNVAVTLAPVASGWSFFLAARRLTRFVPAQVLAAALYGFSPTIVSSEPVGHFFLAWMVFPPLAFLCLYDLLVTKRHRPATVGVALGLVVTLQFFCGTELLAIFGVIGAIALAVALALAPRQAWALRGRLLRGAAAAVVTAGVLLAYPLWFLLDGPQRVIGLAWPGTGKFGSYAGAIVSAGPGVTHVSPLLRLSGYYGPGGPVVVFLGWGVIVFIAASVVVWYRSRLAWVILVAGLASWMISRGPGSMHDGHYVGLWLPARLLGHLPLLDEIIPVRFSAITGLAAGLLLVISADGWWRLGRGRLAGLTGPAHGRRQTRLEVVWAGALTLAMAAALVPVAASYRFPFVIHGGNVPRWFVTAGEQLAPGTVVLTVPYPSSGLPQAMGWQAVAGLRFRLVSGYAIVPGRDGRHSAAASPLGGADAVFDTLSFGLAGPVASGGPAQLAEVRRTLRRWGVGVVVITTVGRDPAFAAAYFTAVLGRPPVAEDGAWAWHGLGSAPPLTLPAVALATCAPGSGHERPPRAAACVLAAAQRQT